MLCRVRRYDSVAALRGALQAGGGPCIARGLGRSYGDAALLSHGVVLDQTGLNRLLDFEEASGVLHCEAGVSLGEIIDLFRPRGWTLPTTPGTRFVTVGGAIAADVHGKNHHVDGTFGRWVRGFSLLLATGEVLTCSPEENREAFWATVGGMGLTGVIVTASVQLRRTETAYLDVSLTRTADLDATLEDLAAGDAGHRYSVAWIDCLSRGRRLGRSVVMLGNDAERDGLPPSIRGNPLRPRGRLSLSVPFSPPINLIRPFSARVFNAGYYASHPTGRSLADHEAFFYPLDNVAHWNRLYGRRGFIQYQALFPAATAEPGVRTLIERVRTWGALASLGVLKRTGPAGMGFLSFPYEGYTLALDIPNPGRRLPELARSLEEVVLRHAGRVYLAKDSTTSAEAFAAMYPQLDRFRTIKHRLDPERRFTSAQAERLGIIEP